MKLKVMVLAGGPDRERPVSLLSGATATAGLSQAGHEVRQRDITPDDLSALDEFISWGGQVILPMLHGSWGEGGGLQRILDERGLPYVGSRAEAADLAMDKHRSKRVFEEHGLPTPAYEVVKRGRQARLSPPVVLKPLREGSSIDVVICRDEAQAAAALKTLLAGYESVLVEQFVRGRELTVGILGEEALPPIEIVPATTYYDYEAKYTREDTQYHFDIDLSEEALGRIKKTALAAHRVLGCRHLSRVDFMVDEGQQPWLLEVNTLPGFTSHSLVPKAAAHAGISLPQLLDRLVRLGLVDRSGCRCSA